MINKRILFVDDEPSVLEGLRDLLRKERKRWDMVFVQSGDAALAELAKGRFDVVVSDMRMPGMDGAELLGRVRDLHPSATRIVLSGHAEREAVTRAATVAHQFLSKPCDGTVLREVIDRTCELRALLDDEALRRIVGEIAKLPSVPATYLEMTQKLASQDAGPADIARIVERDPAMSAKILQLVNSSFFGLAQKMSSVGAAVSYLGLETLRGLALSLHVFSAGADAPPIAGFSLPLLQRSSLIKARVAKKMLADPKAAEAAFTAGLVCDVGKIVLALGMPARFTQVVEAVQKENRSYVSVEREQLSVSHAEIGAYLLGVWGLPFVVVEAVAWHHGLTATLEGALDAKSAVHLANRLVDEKLALPGEGSGESGPVDEAVLQRFGVGKELARYRALVDTECARSGAA